MVPVLDQNNRCLFPCKERRARALLNRKEAVAYWQKGIFCIKLVRKETEKREEYPAVALTVDPGSKREGYTVATEKGVILNITTNTPAWVKAHIETRRMLRRTRRSRKTPYKACRSNRAALRSINRIPPSTKARWNAKLRIIKLLLRLLPVTMINVEDIIAVTKRGKVRWNRSFSPLEIGKNWFYMELQALGPQLIKTNGKQTKQHRFSRNFNKSKKKLDYVWEAHNVDSHSLAEMALGKNIKPFHGMYKIEFLEYHRRQLHVQNPVKGNKRKEYGTTVSMGMSRGSVIRYKGELVYLGGTSKLGISVHDIATGTRITQKANVNDIEVLHTSKWRTQFIPPQSQDN